MGEWGENVLDCFKNSAILNSSIKKIYIIQIKL